MNDILLKTLDGQSVERPPIWLMRQAGRILPQYRAVRSAMKSFKHLVKNPTKAAEVTVQPVDELGVDAAILFSDILVIPEAMGLDYHLIEKKGPSFPETIQNLDDIERLEQGALVAERLQYVYDGIEATLDLLKGRVPLIGFSGAPWTLFCYMLEGQGSKTFSVARRFLYQHPDWSHLLLSKLADSVAAYLNQQLKTGVDVVQIFDSWAGMLGPDQYREFGLQYIERILLQLPSDARTIVFAKGAHTTIDDQLNLPCRALGFDWLVSPEFINDHVGGQKVVQGNLDPCVLYGSEEVIAHEADRLCATFKGKHIVNLGHGVYPDTPLSGVKKFVDQVKSFRY